MSKARLESALLEELQTTLNDACIALKKTADIPITRFTLSIPSFFDSYPHMLELCKQLIGDLTSINAWHHYVIQMSVHKDTHRQQFVKLLNCLLRFVNIMTNKNNQQLIDMMVLLAEIQRNDEESLKSFRQFANMKLGLKSATFVVKYAKYECLGVSENASNVQDDVPVHRAIAIIKAGIKAKAEPMKKLKDALEHYNGILDEINNNKTVGNNMTADADDFVTAEVEVQPRRSARKSLSTQQAATLSEFDDGEVEFNRPRLKKSKQEEPVEDRTIASRSRTKSVPTEESSFDDGEVVFQQKSTDKITSSAVVKMAASTPAMVATFDDGEVVIQKSAPRKRKSMSRKAAADTDDDNTVSLADYCCPTVVIPPAAAAAAVVNASAIQSSSELAPTPAPLIAAPVVTKPELVPVPVQEPVHEKSAPVRKRRVSFIGGKSSEAATSSATTTSAASSVADGAFTNIFTEANRMIVVNNHHYVRLTLLGKGGSSAVHRVASVENGEIYAYKKVCIKDSQSTDSCQEGENSVLEGYINEIKLLKSLSGSAYTIQLFNYEINREENFISMVMEAGDVDLAKVLQKAVAGKSASGSSGAPAAGINPFFTRLMWQEMLESVDYIHSNHVIHGDLKPANFVFIKGHLKLIDFGIAKSYNGDQTTNIYRDSQIGTVNYMAPEAISPYVPDKDKEAVADDSNRKRAHSTRSSSSSNRPNGDNTTGNSTGNSTGTSECAKVMKLGRASDIWSLGCILYQMIYGKPPFSALNTIQKLHAIPNPNYAISYPSLIPVSFCGKENCAVDLDAVDSIKMCLHRNPKERAPIKGTGGLLTMPYLTMDGNSRREEEKPAAIVMTTMKNGGRKPQMVIEDDDGGDSEDLSMDSEELAKSARMKANSDVAIRAAAGKGGVKGKSSQKTEKMDGEEEEDGGVTVAVKGKQLKALGLGLGLGPARLNAPASRRSRSPVRSPLRSVNDENKPPAVNAHPIRATNALPLSLAQQIKAKSASLMDSKASNKWQKAKNPEGNSDMKSVLEKRFAAIRHFLDESDEEEDTSNFDSNMSFI